MEGDLQRTLGRNLRAYRQARGLSQEAFAEILKVHRTYMGGVDRQETLADNRTSEHEQRQARPSP